MQKMAESGGALLLMVGILLSSTQLVSSDPPHLDVSYPQEPQGNYGLVRLSCTNDFEEPLPQPASFRVNDSLIDPDTTLVTVTESGSHYIVFTFTQSQEGLFLCETSAAGSSEEVGLAALPPVSYDGMETDRYIVFPDSRVTRDIELNCAIRPGALAEQYHVEWMKLAPITVVLSLATFDIRVAANYSIMAQYRCLVTIEHHEGRSDRTMEYNGPLIRLHTKALGNFRNNSTNVTVKEGERANFTCPYSRHGNNDIIVFWTVGNHRFDCGTLEEGVAPGNNGCYENDEESHLVIENLAMFGSGEFPVRCNLEQSLEEEYVNDQSFDNEFDDVITIEAFLSIDLGGPRLLVDYPHGNSRSLVHLRCVSGGSSPLGGAVFFKDGVVLTGGPGRHQVSVTSDGDGEVAFTFTPEQEGDFYCQSNGQTSIVISLAASPPENFDGETRDRYIVFPTATSSRDISLSCDIRPGALSNRYSVQWLEYSLERGSFLPLSANTFDIDITASYGQSSLVVPQYQCRVAIEHRNDTQDGLRDYSGPIIRINQKVLASIVGEIEETNVKQGDPIEIKCTIDEHNDDIIVYWMVDSDRYDCRTSSQDIVDSGCYTAGSISFLLLRDTSSLTVGKHRVQCVIWQNLSPEFMEDTSFDSEFNSESETGTLTVLEGDISVAGVATALAAGVGGGLSVVFVLVVFSIGFLCALCFCRRRKYSNMDEESELSLNTMDSTPPPHHYDEIPPPSGETPPTFNENQSPPIETPPTSKKTQPATNKTPPTSDNLMSNEIPPPFNSTPPVSRYTLPPKYPSSNLSPPEQMDPSSRQDSRGSNTDNPDSPSHSGGCEQAGNRTPRQVSQEQAKGRALKYKDLVVELKDLAAQWYIMGLQLGLSPATLDEIGGGRDDASNCLRNVLQEWLESSTPCTKAKIVEAIRCPTIKIMWLAKKIENNTEIPDQLTIENLSLLHDTLTKALAHKFQELGVQLDLELSQIQALSYRRVDMSEHLHKMLQRWMSEGQWSSDERAEPLRHIFEALESDCVRQRRLARELREKWKDCYLAIMDT